MKRTSLFLDDRLLAALQRVARRKRVSVAALVREAVSAYLAQAATPARVPSIAGRFASGTRDTAERTDDLLWRDPHE
ncbi:MAG: ribbon-helix-helix protein, CopG family [Gemmatimonadaceae bacterium]|nr:ribbon-helix-helix protein, CopG family [Gemmatimonadaceae bacterium]